MKLNVGDYLFTHDLNDGIEGFASEYYQAHKVVKVTPKRVYIDVFPDSPGLEQVIVNRLDLEAKGEAWCPGQREIYYTRDRINNGPYQWPVVYRIKAVERRKEMKPIEWHIQQHKLRVKHLTTLRKYGWLTRKCMRKAVGCMSLEQIREFNSILPVPLPVVEDLAEALRWRGRWRRERRYMKHFDPDRDLMETVFEISFEPVGE